MAYPNESLHLEESAGRPSAYVSDPRRGERFSDSTGDRVKDVAGTARDEAAAVTDTAKEAGGHVVDTAKQEAGEVLEEAKVQGRRLLDESMYEFRAQADTGQKKVAELARSLSGELRSMADADSDGMLAEYVDRAQRLSDEAAQWLESRQPDEVLESVRRYAARNPWQFLAISAGVGFIGARVYRGLHDAKADRVSPSPSRRGAAGCPRRNPTSAPPGHLRGRRRGVRGSAAHAVGRSAPR